MAKRYHQTRKDREDERRGMERRNHSGSMRNEGREYHEGFGDMPRKMGIPGTHSMDQGMGRGNWDGSMGYAERKARIEREDYNKIHKHMDRDYVS